MSHSLQTSWSDYVAHSLYFVEMIIKNVTFFIRRRLKVPSLLIITHNIENKFSRSLNSISLWMRWIIYINYPHLYLNLNKLQLFYGIRCWRKYRIFNKNKCYETRKVSACGSTYRNWKNKTNVDHIHIYTYVRVYCCTYIRIYKANASTNPTAVEHVHVLRPSNWLTKQRWWASKRKLDDCLTLTHFAVRAYTQTPKM